MPLTKVPAVRSRRLNGGKVTYFIDYAIDGKRFRETIGPNKQEALKRAARVFADHQNEDAGVLKERARIDLPSLAELFLTSKINQVADSSLKRYRIYTTHLVDFYDWKMPSVKSISEITKGQLQEHILDLLQHKKANKTLNGHIQYLRALFNFAVEEEYLAANPAAKLKTYPERKDEIPPYWTEEEVEKILEASLASWKDKFEFLYHTGLRKSELIFLRRDSVHLKTNPPSIVIRSHDEFKTKSNRSRTVPLNSVAAAIAKRQKPSAEHPYLFSGAKGARIDEDRIYQALKKTLNKLGLKGDVHQWRHTFASHLVMKSVGIETVSKLLGHTTLEMTMRYAHLAPDHLKTAVDKLTG